MKILLYNPDKGVSRNFVPHLWMFLLQALTPPGHEVILVDGETTQGNGTLTSMHTLDPRDGRWVFLGSGAHFAQLTGATYLWRFFARS